MKYLFIILLFLIGCTPDHGGKYTGKIVEMTYNSIERNRNTITVIIGTDTKRIYNSPYFDSLVVGDKVVVECAAGFFATCYITDKLSVVRIEE